jgi:UDP-N-acetylmuramoyl-tripeptide--D-alanyl-D-alanine ligase
MELTAREIADITGGRVTAGDPAARASSFTIDTRALEPGACFVALVGTRDGNDFADAAFAGGASVVVASRAVDVVVPDGGAVVWVDDGYDALARLGRAARAELAHATVIGITGSAGKTGTKDLTAGALAVKLPVHASPGNFNNEAGLPLTLLHAPTAAEVLVLEMGARRHGNIADLCAIALPTVGVITNVGLAHAGLLGGRKGVARAKGELLEALPSGGFAVLHAGEDETPGLAARSRARVLLVGVEGRPETAARAEVVASGVELDAELRPSFHLESPWGSAQVHLEVRGVHQVANAIQAAAVALALGVPLDDVVAGLAAVPSTRWRMQVERARSGAIVIHDAYNASPGSMAAALRSLGHATVPGRRVAVLGEMLELGEHADEEHTRVGRLAGSEGVDALVVVGPGAHRMAAAAREGSTPVPVVVDVADAPGALAAARALGVGAHDIVLVKGSRAVGLEVVADALLEDGPQ